MTCRTSRPASRRRSPSVADTASPVARFSTGKKWWDHKPSSVYSLVRADGHLSGVAVTSHLVRPTRSSNDPGRVSLLTWPCSDRGLPCHACYQTRGGLLPHRFTLTLRIQGRSVLCGPVPSPRGAQALPGGLPCGARTFLDRPLQPAYRDHRPHHFQVTKLPDGRLLGQGLPREAADHATQTVGRGAGEPESGIVPKHGRSQPRRCRRCERRAIGLQTDR